MHGTTIEDLIILFNFRDRDFYPPTKCKLLRYVRLFRLKLVVASSSFMDVLRGFIENLCSHLQSINAAKQLTQRYSGKGGVAIKKQRV